MKTNQHPLHIRGLGKKEVLIPPQMEDSKGGTGTTKMRSNSGNYGRGHGSHLPHHHSDAHVTAERHSQTAHARQFDLLQVPATVFA